MPQAEEVNLRITNSKRMNQKPAEFPMPKLDLKTAGPFIALVAIFIIGVLVNDAFLSSGNLSNILARSSFIGIVAIGATFRNYRRGHRSFCRLYGRVHIRLHDSIDECA